MPAIGFPLAYFPTRSVFLTSTAPSTIKLSKKNSGNFRMVSFTSASGTGVPLGVGRD